MPASGLHKQGMQRLQELHNIGKVLAKAFLELHAVPPRFPPALFSVLAYGGEEETLIRDLIPHGTTCTCGEAGHASSGGGGGAASGSVGEADSGGSRI